MSEYPVEGSVEGTSYHYPWHWLDIGDHFIVASQSETIRRSVQTAARQKGLKVSTRKIDGGLRVVRVA